MLLTSLPVFGLLGTVFGSILEVALLCIAGYIFARKGILDKRTQKHINRINVSLFTPALLFSKVAFFLTPEKLRELWIIPIMFVVTTGCSMFVAYLFGSLLRLKRSQRSFAMAAAMFMNSNSLPVALMQSMVYSISFLKWGDDDTQDAMLGRALTYLVLFSTFGMVLRWSYGVHLLSQADEEEPVKHDLEQPPTESTSLLHHSSQSTQAYSSTSRAHSSPATLISQAKDVIHHHKRSGSNASNGSSDSPALPAVGKQDLHPPPSVTVAASSPSTPRGADHTHHDNGLLHPSSLLHRLDPQSNAKHTTPPQQPNKRHIKPKYFRSFPSTPMYPRSEEPSPPTSPSTASSDSDRGDRRASSGSNTHHTFLPSLFHHSPPVGQPSAPASKGSKTRSLFNRLPPRIRHALRTLNQFMTAPIWAALLSLIVACTPWLQHSLEVHLQPVKKALNAAGACSIPLTMIVLGAYFWVGDESERVQAQMKAEENGTLDKLKGLVGLRRAEKSKDRHHADPGSDGGESESSLVRGVRNVFEREGSNGNGKGKGKGKGVGGLFHHQEQERHMGIGERIEDAIHPHEGLADKIEDKLHPHKGLGERMEDRLEDAIHSHKDLGDRIEDAMHPHKDLGDRIEDAMHSHKDIGDRIEDVIHPHKGLGDKIENVVHPHKGLGDKIEDAIHPHKGLGDRIEEAIHPHQEPPGLTERIEDALHLKKRHEEAHKHHLRLHPHINFHPSFRGKIHQAAPSKTHHTYTSLSDIIHANRSSSSLSLPPAAASAPRPGETRTIFVAVLSRMVLTPLILLPLLTLLIASHATQVFSDPVFILTNVLLITSAPALTLAQITQAASGDAFERLISRTIFWAYCVMTPPLTVASVMLGLVLTKL